MLYKLFLSKVQKGCGGVKASYITECTFQSIQKSRMYASLECFGISLVIMNFHDRKLQSNSQVFFHLVNLNNFLYKNIIETITNNLEESNDF
jgi:hypothetical protein